MEIHPHDKRKEEEELNDQIRPDSGTQDKVSSGQERDLDDFVHKQAFGGAKPDSEIDPDDAVHQKPFSSPLRPFKGDPDDLVHEG